jgi:glucose-1-phosphate adenylyltransferase
MNLAGIIFSNLYDERFGVLTHKRTVASLPFGGRYRFVDFVLSNMSNSGITSVGIITKHNYNSLMDHLGSSAEWDLNRKNGGVHLLAPFSTGMSYVYQGKLEALYTAAGFLEKTPEDYVVLSDSTILCNIDYEEALASHIASGKDVTAIVSRVPADPKKNYELILEMSEGVVTDVTVDYPAMKEGTLASIGMYIMDKKLILSAVRESVSKGRHLLERDFIQEGFYHSGLTINVHEFAGHVIRNDSVASYFANNLALIRDTELRRDLFNRTRPIYTKVRDEVPSYYSPSSSVEDCLIADGCRIHGALEGSVLFRDIYVGRKTVIKNSVIMQGAVIGEGCHIENTIIDKNVTVSDGVRLVGAPLAPCIVEKGETV